MTEKRYQLSSVSVNRPVGVGYEYSTVAYIPEKQGSWALALSHERITSDDTPIEKVAAQLTEICHLLTQRAIVLFDSQYGSAQLLLAIANLACDKLIRLRSNPCVWGQPPEYSGRGHPKKHGHKFKLNDSTTWN